MASTSTVTTLALKEWSAVAHALLDGRQTLLLRKGGIHEKSFDLAVADGDRFVLFPTVAHSHAERVRPEHADLLARGAADVDDDAFTVRAGVSLVAAVPVARPERLDEVADLHIWTAESVRRDRLEFRPKHQLVALVVRAVELPEPVRLLRRDAYAGCFSWLDLPLAWDGSGRQVHTDARLAADAERVRAALT
ncbi:MAG TPA: DUF1802 family protein [Egibacteraceae bacterium]